MPIELNNREFMWIRRALKNARECLEDQNYRGALLELKKADEAYGKSADFDQAAGALPDHAGGCLARYAEAKGRTEMSESGGCHLSKTAG